MQIPTLPTCAFQVVDKNLEIPGDGILGYNFLAKYCNVDGPNKLLMFPKLQKQGFKVYISGSKSPKNRKFA